MSSQYDDEDSEEENDDDDDEDEDEEDDEEVLDQDLQDKIEKIKKNLKDT